MDHDNRGRRIGAVAQRQPSEGRRSCWSRGAALRSGYDTPSWWGPVPAALSPDPRRVRPVGCPSDPSRLAVGPPGGGSSPAGPTSAPATSPRRRAPASTVASSPRVASLSRPPRRAVPPARRRTSSSGDPSRGRAPGGRRRACLLWCLVRHRVALRTIDAGAPETHRLIRRETPYVGCGDQEEEA